MHSFSSYTKTLVELAYNHRDDLEVDSRLLWMGIKNHLRNPDNFKKLLDSHSHFKDMFGLLNVHEYKLPSNNFIHHEDLKQKYEHILPHIMVGPFEKGLLTVGSKRYGSMSPPKNISKGWLWWKTSHKTAPINLFGFKSLHPDNIKQQSFQDTHKQFMGELSERFSTWHHEFTHFHDFMIKGKPYPTGSKMSKNYDYHNDPHEIHAHNQQLNYELDKAIRLKPHRFHNLPVQDKHYEVLQRLSKIDSPDFKEDFEGRLDKLKYELDNIANPKIRKNWHYHYDKLKPENKAQFNATIDTILNKYAHKLHPPKIPKPSLGWHPSLEDRFEEQRKKSRRESQKRYRDRKKKAQEQIRTLNKPKTPKKSTSSKLKSPKKKALAEAWQWHVRKYPNKNKPTKLRAAVRYLDVGPHKLSIHFQPQFEEKRKLLSKETKEVVKPREYEVAYKVDDSIEAGKVTDPKHQKTILKTVHNTIDKFVTRIKPKALHFLSVDDPTKARLHVKLAAHLAKKYGGKDSLYTFPDNPRKLYNSKVKFKRLLKKK